VLPDTPAAIDPDWLSAALGERYPGVQVALIDIVETHELTNLHARLRVTYDEAAGAPSAMFCKLPPVDPARRASIAGTGMGRREARFYAELAETVAMRVPTTYFSRDDETDGSFLLLLEDLTSTGCTVPDGTRGISPDSAAGALEDLAALHCYFEDPQRRQAEAPWVPTATRGNTYGATMLGYALEHHRDRLSHDFSSVAELYISHGEALEALWRRGPTTVVHGDPHIGNLFDDHGRTGFLDWGLIKVFSPMRDVSYFLAMGLSIDDRRQHESALLRQYLDARSAGGGAPISFDEAWLAHRLHAAYTVPACCQIVMFPPGQTERRRIFAEAFLARAEAALADLEARAAVREATGL
jgi:phosphotransferase family enzyme